MAGASQQYGEDLRPQVEELRRKLKSSEETRKKLRELVVRSPLGLWLSAYIATLPFVLFPSSLIEHRIAWIFR